MDRISVILVFVSVPYLVTCAAVEGGPYPLESKEDAEKPSIEYGVVVDAGSSGSRARVYSWPKQVDRYTVPEITEVFNHKENPGVSSFGDNLDGLDDYIAGLISKAVEHVPEDVQAQTRLYCMATAGMRLLLEDKANAVIDKIDSIFKDPDVNPFSYESLNTRILSGEEEGVFAWIAVNYLNGYFNRRKSNPDELSAGIVEMGGASLQIAFQPDGSILADKFPVKVGGQNYPLYVHSYLYYGQDYAHQWVREYLYDESTEKDNIINPCLFKDDSMTKQVYGEDVTYLGSGDPEQCRDILDVYVYDVDPRRCHPKPCSIGTVYQPTIDEDMNFFAVGAFIHTLTSLKVVGEDGSFDLRETNTSAYAYCSKSIQTLKNETGRDDPYESLRCLTSLYIPTIFVKAFRFDEDTAQLKVVDEVNGQPAEWSLGAIIYENERREWKCPPAKPTSGATSVMRSSSAVCAGLLLFLHFLTSLAM